MPSHVAPPRGRARRRGNVLFSRSVWIRLMKNHHNGMSIQLLRLNRLDDTPSDSKISVTVPFLLLINPYLHKVATLTLDRREYVIWFHYIQVLNRQKHILLETLKKTTSYCFYASHTSAFFYYMTHRPTTYC
jgi:hypothetical protein